MRVAIKCPECLMFKHSKYSQCSRSTNPNKVAGLPRTTPTATSTGGQHLVDPLLKEKIMGDEFMEIVAPQLERFMYKKLQEWGVIS